MYHEIKAVLFDLDDTLSDHQHSRRCGLETLRSKYPLMKRIQIEALEIEHEKILQGNYQHTLDGILSMEDATASRLFQLCSRYGLTLSMEEAKSASIDYEAAYLENRRAVPGARELLEYLSAHVRIGVVTNGLDEIQREKIRYLGLDSNLSFVLVSEAIGIRKPNPGIFLEALRLAEARAESVVFIGDSWDSDILGAHQCGLRTIWLNRYGLNSPDPSITSEISSLEPLQCILKNVLDS